MTSLTDGDRLQLVHGHPLHIAEPPLIESYAVGVQRESELVQLYR